MPSRPTELLAKLVRQKRAVLEQLCAVAQRQASLIDAGEMGPLIQLLSAKQQLVNALRTVEQNLAPYRDENPDDRLWSSAALRATCAEDSQECSRLLDRLFAMEQDQTKQMTDRRDGVAAQLRQMQSSHEAASAYQPHRGKQATPAPVLDVSSTGALGSLDLTSH